MSERSRWWSFRCPACNGFTHIRKETKTVQCKHCGKRFATLCMERLRDNPFYECSAVECQKIERQIFIGEVMACAELLEAARSMDHGD